MFAKLRPGHRRSGSTPTSPSPNQIPSGFLPIPPSSSHGPTSPSSIEDFLHGFKSPPPPSSQQQASNGPSPLAVTGGGGGGGGGGAAAALAPTTTGESPISPMPPNLPPIPRIASVYGKEDVQEMAQGLGIGIGIGGSSGSGVHHPELQRAKTTESFDTQSSGSPVLGDQAVFSPPGRLEQSQLQAQERLRDMRSPSGSSDQYRSPSSMSQLASPHVRREAGISESEFRSILQGKHLPPIPGTASHPSRSPHDVITSPPALQPPTDELHASHAHHSFSSRQSAMSLAGNQSRQSLAASMTTTTSRSGDRATKTKTRLLNPMSLLLRRRNGQTLDHLAEESLVSHRNPNLISPGLPDNFDPSIRGNVVHDFSAPRPRRNFSSQNMAELTERERREAVAAAASMSSSSREGHYVKTRAMSEDLRHDRQHTPVFKEHFEDDADADADRKKRADSALRAENLANTDFISRNSLLLSEENAAPLPPFARAGQKTVYKPPLLEQPPSQSPPPPPVPAKDEADEPPLLSRSQQQPTPLSPLMEDPVSPTTVLDADADADADPDATPKRQSNTSTLRQHSTTASHRSPASARSSRISRMNSAASQNGLPSHMFSRASRFSFQYSSTDSAAQERLLEERHREKAAKAKAERGSVGYEDEDEFDYDGMDMDAMDDDVPMNGEDWDYGGGGLGIGNMTLEDMQMGGGGGGGLGGMTLDDFGPGGGGGGLGGMSLDDFGGGGLGNMSLDDFEGGSGGGGLGGMTLDDMSGTGARGLGNMTLEDLSSKDSAPTIPEYSPLRENPLDTNEATAGASMGGFGLGINAAGKATAAATSMPHSHTSSTSIKRKPVGGEPPPEQDDFYFEDGEFADEDFLREINGTGEEEDAFDESVFDDPNHPLYERRQPTQAPPIPRMSSKRTHNTLKGRKPRSRPPSDPMPEHPDPGAPSHQVEAYQSALAMFANKAAAAGRFDRANSVDSSASSLAYQGGPVQEKPPTIAAAPELTPDVARFSRDSSTISPATARASGGNDLDSLSKSVGFMLPGAGAYEDSYASDFDYSDYDSTFEDDPMIAAANAEALENDDEGLYGSEFGFYARPGASADNPDDPTSAMYGGYFGPKNWGEIKRQRSTREPNLTPITERSEYSTRNSFIGLGFAEHERVGAGGQPSPALAQLARMSQSPGWEGDMNIETLLKLRNRAWGGSQGSNIDKSSPRQGSSSPMGLSPVVSKGEGADKRQQLQPLWTSSPMSRSVFSPGEAGIPENPDPDADDEFDEEMLREANYDDDEEGDEEEYEDEDGEEGEDDEEGIEEQDDSWQGQDYDGVSPLEEESPPSESPTIRASAATLQSTTDAAVSPINIGAPFSFPTSQSHSHPQSHHHTSPKNLSLATTATTSSSSTVLVSPISPAGIQHFKPAHSRSGSDSVSYLRERDEEKGEFRWVLERRRTAEDGAEVVERTAVEGGRI